MSPTLSQQRAELNERAWEAIDSLVHTLGSTLNAREIAKRSLLTVTGQLLLQRAAFYVFDPEQGQLLLMESLGVRRQILGEGAVPLDDDQRELLDSIDGIYDIDENSWLPEHLSQRFDFAARIREGELTLGLLLLGGKIGQDHFDDLDRRLLHTMGMVMGTTLQRSLSHQHVTEAQRRTKAIQNLQQQILDHVTHEFNTPLTVIRSAVDLIHEGDGETAEQAYAMHAESLDRLQSLVQSIVDAGHATFNEGALELRTPRMIRQLCLVPLLESSHWKDELVVDCLEDTQDTRLQVDLGGLRTALDALLDNAYKFSLPTRRRLGVFMHLADAAQWMNADHRARLEAFSTCDAETLREQGADVLVRDRDSSATGVDTLIIEVLDAGIGIPANERSLVFEPFAQASNSPYRHVSGTGMGLMSARARIERMGGTIRVVSAENAGSLFAILLPLAATEPATEPVRY